MLITPFICIFLLILMSPSLYAKSNSTQRHVASIEKMVKAGILSEEEGKEQIGQIQIEDEAGAHTPLPGKRGIASVISEQKIINFSNQAIEIQVK